MRLMSGYLRLNLDDLTSGDVPIVVRRQLRPLGTLAVWDYPV